ncbi:MAG: sugar transferase [Methylacidiphilales bacterium]|nr:sugar transferase [Candidatus Methylacidiphilales bacterium]NJR17559.1 sugar transferase [Calothrix sp. CSU_2_0]
MKNGIYTLANDVVYDQLVALLNSIEVNAGREIPVCVIPYDNRLEKVRAEIATRNNVTLFENNSSINRWEDFSTQAWKSHHRAQKAWQTKGLPPVYRLAMHRKLCAFDGDFEKFIYFDADTLLIGSVDNVYQQLNTYDWVANDFQYKSDLKYIFDGPPELLEQVFGQEKLKSGIFCAGWFAGNKGVFNEARLENILNQLKAGEADVMALGGPDQSLFNYMVLRSDISYYNFCYDNLENTPGNHWSSNFTEVENVLYDQGRRLTYLHYMSVPSSKFTSLCQGEDVDIPYKEIFLHYRYLKSPESRPKVFTQPSSFAKLQKSTSDFVSQKASNIMHKYRQLQNLKNL